MNRTSFFLLSIALLIGCGGTPQLAAPAPEPDNAPDNPMAAELNSAPEWVRGDCRSGVSVPKGVICGIGSVGGTMNPSLARTGAEARARAAIARELQTAVKAMVKDYQATMSGGDHYAEVSLDEQYLTDVSTQIAEQTISGSRTVNSWISPSGAFYVLVVLDSDAFGQALAQMNALDEKIRRGVEARAERAFDDLDRRTVVTSASVPSPAEQAKVLADEGIAIQKSVQPSDPADVRASKFSAAEEKFSRATALAPEGKYYFFLCSACYWQGKYRAAAIACTAVKPNGAEATYASSAESMLRDIKARAPEAFDDLDTRTGGP